MRNPDKLRVGPAAIDLAVLVYEYTREFPPEERFGLAFHMRKTAIAIGSSIFEACGRLTNKGFVAALGVSHSEANEMLFQLRVALRLEFGDRSLGVRVHKKLAHMQRMLSNLIKEARNLPDFK